MSEWKNQSYPKFAMVDGEVVENSKRYFQEIKFAGDTFLLQTYKDEEDGRYYPYLVRMSGPLTKESFLTEEEAKEYGLDILEQKLAQGLEEVQAFIMSQIPSARK